MKPNRNFAVCALFVTMLMSSVTARAADYDLERDYSATTNPNGVWSYGWFGSLSGGFNLMSYHAYSSDGIDYWLATSGRVPSVYHNGSSATIIGNLGQGTFPPGTVWMGPGYEGTPENYSVIRFTVPADKTGFYRVETIVRSVLEGNLSTDADFHVLHKGVELFGFNVPASQGSGYTNELDLAAGDALYFVTGRGADDHVQGSGLKIKAFITLIEPREPPPPPYVPATYDLEREYSGTANPAGVWTYGWKGNLAGTFNLMSFHGVTAEGLDYWLATPSRVPSVYHNGTSNTVIGNMGQGIFPSGTVWMGPGYEGTPENYSVIRFTAPEGARYELETAVKSVLSGNLSSDADFHVFHNATEVFGLNVPANGAAGYTNTVEVVAGDTIDFVTGRGADDRLQGSGLKIKGLIRLVDQRPSAPRILEQPRDQTVVIGGTAAFTVRAAGTEPLEFQWFKDSTEISGANSATLSLTNAQASDGGAYTVRVRNNLGSATADPAILTLRAAYTYDLERDYTGTNPAGPWSYGWLGTLSSAFNPMTFHATTPEGIDYWLATTRVPSVYHNGTSNTIVSNLGQGNYPPGTIWMGPGYEGTSENYSVIRFTVPAGANGSYRVQTSVDSVLDGNLSTDADFHVFKNGVELFGTNVPSNGAAGYTNAIQLLGGDTIDFVTGRGADDRVQGSGLSISHPCRHKQCADSGPRFVSHHRISRK